MSLILSADTLLIGVNLASFASNGQPYGIIEDAAVVIFEDNINWVGKAAELPELSGDFVEVSLGGKWLTPGLIDCHTHLVFAGNRADEFEQRLQGVSYADIAKQGGGIAKTVAATRDASEQQLLSMALKSAQTLLEQGVTTIEVKSGYGLDLATESKMLQVARQIDSLLPVTIKTTFLGAHALAPEYKERADDYIELVCENMLPAIAQQNLADAVDVFCESIGFTLEQTKRIFEKASQLGLPVKLHAEQLTNLGGSELAASFNALSVDHIEFLDEAGVKAIAQSGTVATLLPGAFYFLKETQKPPVELLRQYKVPMAIATDFNPGSSPICNLPLMINMACTLFALTPEEALQGVTLNAAKALGLDEMLGSIETGKQADLVCWDIQHPNQLAYMVGTHKPLHIWQKGKQLSLHKGAK
ncbi:imidazolonepropionase [Neptunicella marina]|uniref:Imidazolonepropionase n=1 Tax=Neptunicella marina TaxID=2125989 RepID=A0A8J6LZF2_9ALTE|nr:imidazolonepropionase [Neptunicella marina]MBC3766599.1 imidazolonepropionase [Neptunicella marina]